MIDFFGLDIIEFHDLPVEGIYIKNGITTDLVIEICEWDDDSGDYLNKTLFFKDLKAINPDNILLEGNDELEIYSFDYHMNNGLFHGKMIISTGFAKPDVEFEFSCREVDVKEVKK